METTRRLMSHQGVHGPIGYGAVLTATLRFHDWTYGFLAVLAFAMIKEFIIDIFGKEHDSFLSSLKDFTFYVGWRSGRNRRVNGQMRAASDGSAFNSRTESRLPNSRLPALPFSADRRVWPTPAESHYHQIFENRYVRVFRVELPPHSQKSVYQNTHNLVWVALSDSTLSIVQSEGGSKELRLRTGDTRFSAVTRSSRHGTALGMPTTAFWLKSGCADRHPAASMANGTMSSHRPQ
jgi:hypothetical protein